MLLVLNFSFSWSNLILEPMEENIKIQLHEVLDQIPGIIDSVILEEQFAEDELNIMQFFIAIAFLELDEDFLDEFPP